MRKAIRISQKQHWKELIKEVDEDPWGVAFRIITKRLRIDEKIPGLENKTWVEGIIDTLFPEQNPGQDQSPKQWFLKKNFSRRESYGRLLRI